jgi:hypothetical protein
MNIINRSAANPAQVMENQIQKGIGSIVFLSTMEFTALDGHKISLYLERQNGNNIDITEGLIDLKMFLLSATYGSDAITSLVTGGITYKTCAVIELAEAGFIEMGSHDRLNVRLEGMSAGEAYLIDGWEENEPSKEIYEYRMRTVPADQDVYTVDVDNFDTLVMQEVPEVAEMKFVHDNGIITTHTYREIHALSQDLDPVALVKSNGTVLSGIPGFIQFPVKDIRGIEFRKTGAVTVKVLVRKDIDLAHAANFN